MYLASLALRDFRRYDQVEVDFDPGVTVIAGPNGAGKTSLLEAGAWVALGRSFRGVPDAALVREGCASAILRAVVVDGERRQSLDAELRVQGRNRVLVNGTPLARTRDRLEVLRVTIFAPDDLALVKGAPAGRRDYLDDLLVALAPRYEAARADYERALRHRNALLKGGLRGPDALTTLDVFDEQLTSAGAELVRGRLRLVERLGPEIAAAYGTLAGHPAEVGSEYVAEWAVDGVSPSTAAEALGAALRSLRPRELERQITLAGPHRDEWRLRLDGLDTRSHASQGEQRSLALALRLAAHALVRSTLQAVPVLLLDDVFSELDTGRAEALAAALPAGQTLITTASPLPPAVVPDVELWLDAGALTRGPR